MGRHSGQERENDDVGAQEEEDEDDEDDEGGTVSKDGCGAENSKEEDQAALGPLFFTQEKAEGRFGWHKSDKALEEGP